FFARRRLRFVCLGASSGALPSFLASSGFLPACPSSSRGFFFRGSSPSSAAPACTTLSSQGNTWPHLGHSISESGSGAAGGGRLALHAGQRSSQAMVG